MDYVWFRYRADLIGQDCLIGLVKRPSGEVAIVYGGDDVNISPAEICGGDVADIPADHARELAKFVFGGLPGTIH